MQDYVISSTGHRFTEIPRKIWEQHVKQTSHDISKMLSFMTNAHHLIRNFTVCAHCDHPIKIKIDSEMNCEVAQENGNLLIFYPQIDWESFSAPNIIPDF